MNELLTPILNQLKLITDLKEVGIYNKQFETVDKNESVFLPAAFIEIYGGVTYEQLLNGFQAGTCTVRVHIANDSPLQGANNNTEIYQLAHKVNGYLQGFTNGSFNELFRTGEELDNNHTNIYIYKQDYLTRFVIDTTLPDTNQPITINEVNVTYDLVENGSEKITDVIK